MALTYWPAIAHANRDTWKHGRRAGMLEIEPTDIPNLAFWGRPTEASVVKDASNNVSQLTDRSGHARHATQGTAANKPLWVASGIGGQPSLRFTAASKHHLLCNGLAALLAGSDKPFTLALVAQCTDATTAHAFFGAYNSAGSADLYASVNTGTRLYTERVDDAAVSKTLPTNTAGDLGANVHRLVFTGTTISWYKNGTAIASAVNFDVGTFTVDTVVFGERTTTNTAAWQGDIADIALYTADIGTQAGTLLDRVLGRRYGIAVA